MKCVISGLSLEWLGPNKISVKSTPSNWRKQISGARGSPGGQSWPFEACYSPAWWPSPPWNVAGDGLDLTCKTRPVRTFFTSNNVQFVWGGKNNRNSLKSGGYNFTSLQLGAINRDNIKQDYRVLAWNPQMILHSWNLNLATGLALWEKSKYHDQETEIFIVLLSYMTNHLRPLAVKISVITIFISNNFCLPTPSSLCFGRNRYWEFLCNE